MAVSAINISENHRHLPAEPHEVKPHCDLMRYMTPPVFKQN
ncbi:hypothetical protein RCCS2_17501 [Roseobacter sp. CCS2]|nr:hypothetical protein RCCS2_17501 [Roseobacter sp. CCS2]